MQSVLLAGQADSRVTHTVCDVHTITACGLPGEYGQIALVYVAIVLETTARH